jgi:hypothetical protein
MEEPDPKQSDAEPKGAEPENKIPAFGMADISTIIAEEIDAAGVAAPFPEPASGPDKPLKKRPVWVHLVVLFFQILFLTPFYAVILAGAVGAGVGWHYFDADFGNHLYCSWCVGWLFSGCTTHWC